MSAANEVAVDLFLQGRIAFPEISARVERVMTRHSLMHEPDLGALLEADAWARRTTLEV
jgi:1-deoxy-D-xylulose-5-phosphate reductoisomerase